MSYWDFKNIGFICDEENIDNVKRLLECFGVDFDNPRGSEAGKINSTFWYEKGTGAYKGNYKVSEIYSITNKLYGNTTILYEHEDGDNTSDWYTRYEEVYDSKTNVIYIGERDYYYGDRMVFGENVYSIIKEECEEAAKRKGIPIEWGESEWRELYPEDGEFYDICEDVIDNHGGLSGLGTREWTEGIQDVEIGSDIIARLYKTASKKGYADLAALIKETPLNRRIYRMCKVSFIDGEREYIYLTGKVVINVGDYVEVPTTTRYSVLEEAVHQAKVTEVFECSKKTSPIHINKLKTVIRKISENEINTVENGILYNHDKTVLLKYIGHFYVTVKSGTKVDIGEKAEKVIMPETVKEIAPRAFYYQDKLSEVILNEGLLRIGEEAFVGTGLASVEIPASVEYIGDNAFSSAHSIYRPKLLLNENNPYIRTDGKCLYNSNNEGEARLLWCHNYDATRYTLSDKTVEICKKAFDGCYSIRVLYLNAGLKKIGEGALDGIELRNLSIPKSVTDISYDLFTDWNRNMNCSIHFEYGGKVFSEKDGVIYKKVSDGYEVVAYQPSRKKTVVIRKGTITIKKEAFEGNSISTVLLPTSLRLIEEGAFSFCNLLNTVTINNKKYEKEKGVIRFPKGIKEIRYGAFSGCHFSKLETFPGIKKIINDSFERCEVEEVYISASCDEVDADSICCTKRYIVDEKNAVFCTLNGVLYNKTMTEIVDVPSELDQEEFIIPNTVKRIGTAFSKVKKIRRIVLNDKIKRIDACAFPATVTECVVGISVNYISPSAFYRWNDNECRIIGESGSYAEVFVKNMGKSKKHRRKYSFIAFEKTD